MCGSSDFIDTSAIVELEAFDGWNREVSGGCSISGKHVAVADLDLLRLVVGANLGDHLKVGSCERSKLTTEQSASNCDTCSNLNWEYC